TQETSFPRQSVLESTEPLTFEHQENSDAKLQTINVVIDLNLGPDWNRSLENGYNFNNSRWHDLNNGDRHHLYYSHRDYLNNGDRNHLNNSNSKYISDKR